MQPTSKTSTSDSSHKQANLIASKLVQAQNPYNLEVDCAVQFRIDPTWFQPWSETAELIYVYALQVVQPCSILKKLV